MHFSKYLENLREKGDIFPSKNFLKSIFIRSLQSSLPAHSCLRILDSPRLNWWLVWRGSRQDPQQSLPCELIVLHPGSGHCKIYNIKVWHCYIVLQIHRDPSSFCLSGSDVFKIVNDADIRYRYPPKKSYRTQSPID